MVGSVRIERSRILVGDLDGSPIEFPTIEPVRKENPPMSKGTIHLLSGVAFDFDAITGEMRQAKARLQCARAAA